MGRASAIAGVLGATLFASVPSTAAAFGATRSAASGSTRPAASGPSESSRATARSPAAARAPRGRAAALASFEGSAWGTVVEDRTHTDPSDGLNLTSNSEIGGKFSFNLEIGPDGELFGEGHGDYTEANYSAEGSWEKGAISCEVPVTGSAFRVTAGGKVVPVIGGKLGEFVLGGLDLTLDGAEETSPEVPCGAEFSIFETTTTILADSLAAVLEPPAVGLESPLVLKDEGVSDTLQKDVPYDNGAGEVGSDDGTWTFVVTPTSALKLEAQALESLALAAAGSAVLMQSVIEQCLALIPPPFETNCTVLFRYLSAASAAQAQSYEETADDPIDRHFTSVAKPFVGPAPPIRSLPDFDAKQAVTLERLVKADARVVGLASATATAINRYGGATLAKNAKWEHKQLVAARLYAGKLASGLAGELTDAKAASGVLAGTVLKSLKVTAAQFRASREVVREHGLPSSLTQELERLRLSTSTLARIRLDLERATAAIVSTPASLPDVLDTPLQEQQTRAAIGALRGLAKKGR